MLTSGKVRSRAWGFAALVLGALLCVQGWYLWKDSRARVEAANASSRSIATAIARYADGNLHSVERFLFRLRDHFRAGELDAQHLARMQAVLDQYAFGPANVHAIYVVDAAGRQIFEARRGAPGLAQFARELDWHSAQRTEAVHIGLPGAVSPDSGGWLLPVSVRLEDQHGRFAGVALALLALDAFSGFHTAFDTGRQGAILLANADGEMLLTRPFEAARIGQQAGLPPQVFAAADSREGSFAADGPFDDVQRLYSYQRLDHFPLAVAVGLAAEEVHAGWWRSAARSLLLLLVLALPVALAVWWTARRLQLHLHDRGTAERRLEETVSELLAVNSDLERMSMEDELTGLANRRCIDARLTEECGRAARNGRSVALLAIDVDHFKSYNDLYGHPAGDECLYVVARAIRSGANRNGDLVARYGGEEFLVLCPETDLRGGVVVAERIRQAIERLRLPHTGSTRGHVTASIGVAAARPDGPDDASRLLAAADAALYRAKGDGRNSIQVEELPHAATT